MVADAGRMRFCTVVKARDSGKCQRAADVPQDGFVTTRRVMAMRCGWVNAFLGR